MSTTASISHGLTLLQRARPEVIEGQMQLLGRLGGSLDGKTRQLLLLALQVTQGSTEGLRHHVPRARQAGATGDEVLGEVAGEPVRGTL